MRVDQIYPERYQDQLEEKVVRLKDLFAPYSVPELEVFDSPTGHYRMRAEFKIWHQGDSISYAMYQPGEHRKPVLIDSFPVASKQINDMMPVLLGQLSRTDLLKKRLFQVEFLNSLSGELVITLIYHKPLSEDWVGEATGLKEHLSGELKVSIIGRSRKQKCVIGDDFVEEVLTVDSQTYHYQQVEASFTQPNAKVCEKMLFWARDCLKESKQDLLELYCGNGNFTIPLAQHFRSVVATEISKTSVKSALYNLEKNGIGNVEILRMSSEEFAEAMDGTRKFRRLAGVDLTSYDFSTVLVDPPRAGLDDHTVQIVSRFDRILYISCNPNTLCANLDTLSQTHEVTRFALFDQFPYTDHVECGVMLSRRA